MGSLPHWSLQLSNSTSAADRHGVCSNGLRRFPSGMATLFWMVSNPETAKSQKKYHMYVLSPPKLPQIGVSPVSRQPLWEISRGPSDSPQHPEHSQCQHTRKPETMSPHCVACIPATTRQSAQNQSCRFWLHPWLLDNNQIQRTNVEFKHCFY